MFRISGCGNLGPRVYEGRIRVLHGEGGCLRRKVMAVLTNGLRLRAMH